MIPGRLGRIHVTRHSIYEGINIIGQSQDLHVHCNGLFGLPFSQSSRKDRFL